MKISDKHLVFILGLLLVAIYLIKPDETTKTLSVMVIGGFLALVKQAGDAKREEAEEKEDKEKKTKG